MALTAKPPESSTAPSGRLTLGLALAASVGLLGALTVVRYLPTHDGPQHVYLAHLENHFSDPDATYSSYYIPTTALGAKGFSLLQSPLAELLPWRSALQVTLAVILLTWGWGALAFMDAVSRGRRLVGLAGFGVAFQWSLYMGFFPFVLSTGLGLFTLSIAFRSTDWPWKRRLTIAGLLLLQAVCHVFAAEVVALTLVVLVTCRQPARRWPRELALLACMGIPTALIAVHATGWVGSTAHALPAVQARAVWPPLAERINLLATAFTAGPWWRGWPPVALAMVGIGCGVRRTIQKQASPEERALLVTSVLLGAAALAFPLHTREWEYMSVRFTPMAVVFGLALLPVEALERRGATLVHSAIVVMVVSAIGWAGWHNRRLERACGPALAGLDADIKRTGPRLPIVLDPGCNAFAEDKAFVMPGAEPLLNLGGLYAVQQGGVVPYAFVTIPQLHGFVLSRAGYERFHEIPDRKQLWADLIYADPVADAALREGLLTTLAHAGAGYQDVVFYGPEADARRFSSRGYVTDFERDRLWIGHYRGCPLRLEVQTDGAAAAPLIVEYGWAPLVAPADSKVVPADATREAEAIVVDWKSAPCGPVWVRAGFDKDASGRWKPGSGQCDGAGPDGRLTLQRTMESPSARCVVRRP